MKSIEILRFLCWFCGIIIFGIGIYLKANNKIAYGLTSNRVGQGYETSIDGNSAIFVGISFIISYFLIKIFIKIDK